MIRLKTQKNTKSEKLDLSSTTFFRKKSGAGFTLIEVIIYIGLFSILIGGVLVSAFQLMQSATSLNSKTTLQDEGNFVLRKIDWALTGISSTTPPVITGTSCLKNITIHKINYAHNPIVIRLTSTSSPIEIQEGLGAFVPLTTANVKVTCLEANNIPPVGTGPAGIIATTTINGVDFVITKYIRK